jgi:pimeloyl-ACP methyl ester carboxylesterase
MRRSLPALSTLACLSFSMALPLAGCLSQPTATAGDGGADGATHPGSGSGTGAGSSGVASSSGANSSGGSSSSAGGLSPSACGGGDGGLSAAMIAAATNDQDAVRPYITYMDDLSSHPGCTIAGLATRQAADGTPAGYTAAVINGGNFKCSAKDFGTPSPDDPTNPIIVLVHGNSSTPNDWQAYVNDAAKTPMIAETLVADGYHVYASDVRFDMVPTDMTNNPAKNYDHGWAVPIVQSLLENLFEQYPPPRMFNIAGFSIGPTVIRDALRRMYKKCLNPFSRVHALHFASGGNHGVSTYTMNCGTESSPANSTMAGLASCQLGNRTGYVLTPFETPLNGAQTDIASFDTPCADGNTAYGLTGVCGGNKVVYTTVVFADQPNGSQLDEFVSQASSMLAGATNMTVTQPEPGVCTPAGSTMCQGYFFYPNFEYHYGSIRSAQGIGIAKAALESK